MCTLYKGLLFYSDYNKMRYNYSFLKTEHENLKVCRECTCVCVCVLCFVYLMLLLQSKHQTIVEELQARHQAEVSTQVTIPTC